ncbi:MAG: dockerin type I domain-containing protein, partial [Acutalibacteraceae bacterium]|jgi:hypothetical protein
VVHPGGSGATSITAAVTYNGQTVSDSFPVVVVVELEGICVDGQPLKDFSPSTTEYNVPVDSDHPVITVPGVPEENVTIVNATGVPGTATVTISVGGTDSAYTLHFVKRSHDYVVARFSNFEGVYTTSGKKTLGTDWKAIDGGAPVNFMTHDLSDLHLRMVLKLEQTGAVKVDDTAYRSGFLKLRSVDDPSENNAGWHVGDWHLKTGVNFVDIPLADAPRSRAGTLDWTQINRIQMFIDSLNNYEGPFVATISDVVVVDTGLDPAREELWQYVDDGVDEANYTQASLKPYQQAKMAIQSLIFSADPVSQQTVDQAIAAYEAAKAGLREDVYLIGTFPNSNRTSMVLKSGDNFTGDILYNDWTNGANVPFDLSGDRSNLRLQMTVKFISETDAIAGKDIWQALTIKLRSSDEAGRDGNPNNSEHNYGWDIHPAEVTDPETVQISIDLSSASTNARGLIDWADVRRLIILGNLSQQARNVGARDKYKMQVTGAQIVDLTNVKAEQAEMKDLLATPVNTDGADPAAVQAYNDAKAAAEAVVDTEMVSPADLYPIHMALQDTVDALKGDEPQPPAPTKGDVDGKDGVTAADALMALQAATGKINLTADQQAAADVDGTPGVTAADALMILQYATGKITAFGA